MSIELVYGFVEQNSSIHINEEELLIDYGVNLYSLKLSSGCASKACYGITPVLSSDLKDCGEIDWLNNNISSILRSEDIESIEKLYTVYKKNNCSTTSLLGLHIVYSTPLPFDSNPYSLRSTVFEQKFFSNSDQKQSKLIDPLEKLYKDAQDHIEEQVQNQKRVIEYLEKLRQDSRYKFKLVHNLPSKDFLANGNITLKYDLQIFDQDDLIHHVKIVSSGLYTESDGYIGSVKQALVVSNNNFVPDEDFMGEFESWVYLYEDGSIFKELTQPLDEYFDSMC